MIFVFFIEKSFSHNCFWNKTLWPWSIVCKVHCLTEPLQFSFQYSSVKFSLIYSPVCSWSLISIEEIYFLAGGWFMAQCREWVKVQLGMAMFYFMTIQNRIMNDPRSFSLIFIKVDSDTFEICHHFPPKAWPGKILRESKEGRK